jgi:transcriptional regulator with XRE-family HTH domain
MTGLARNTIAKIERDETREIHPKTMGRILPFFKDRFREAFPETDADPYDFLLPPVTLGAWIRNQRLRRGMPLKKLAAALSVVAYSVIRYEADLTTPDSSVQSRLRALFGDGFHRFLVGGIPAANASNFTSRRQVVRS